LGSDSRKLGGLARFRKMDNKLQAGRFILESGRTPDQILDALLNGKPELYRITIPEGLTWWQTADLLDKEGLARFDDFKNAIHDPEFLRHYGIPFASAEGFLMPDTYLFKKPDIPPDADESAINAAWAEQSRNIAGRLADNFWRKADALWPEKDGKAVRPDREGLKKYAILASIVEKETGMAAERARVAGVYANRLDKNMKLQADPTVAYGIGPAFKGPLKRSQLDDPANTYNTYQHAGLPPGPICSFGSAALAAAIAPEKHDFLYFVAKTDGGEHQFSRALEEHNRAVEAYRRQKKNRR
ncbi:MAG: endolytic transglycosylase MltG, partial [Desulfovibrio sp.]|nr:endolytic transglycosylase MltG [Desulfovibrio sp.]